MGRHHLSHGHVGNLTHHLQLHSMVQILDAGVHLVERAYYAGAAAEEAAQRKHQCTEYNRSNRQEDQTLNLFILKVNAILLSLEVILLRAPLNPVLAVWLVHSLEFFQNEAHHDKAVDDGEAVDDQMAQHYPEGSFHQKPTVSPSLVLGSVPGETTLDDEEHSSCNAENFLEQGRSCGHVEVHVTVLTLDLNAFIDSYEEESYD